MTDFHSIVYCECGAALEKRLLEAHKQNDCPRRIVTCSYCPLEMPYVEKFEHEIKCGSQTIRCEQCKRYIQKRDYPVHQVECATLSASGYPASPPAPGFYTPHISSPRPASPFSATSAKRPHEENLMVCPVCMSPFEHLDDLQVHMISVHEGHMDEETSHATTTTNDEQTTSTTTTSPSGNQQQQP